MIQIMQKTKSKKGINPFQTRPDGSNLQKDRVKNKSHNLLKRKDGSSITSDQLKNGTHNSQKIYTCPHCNKIGKGILMKKWHFENCKLAAPAGFDPTISGSNPDVIASSPKSCNLVAPMGVEPTFP